MTDDPHYVQANGLNIYYEVYGAGPPLILVHGGMGISQEWADQAQVFAEYFEVYVPESRGHGHTDNPAGTLSYRVMGDDLAGFITSIGLQRPLVYGYSDGGQIALELAMRYPELPQAVIIAATWFKFSDSYRASVESFLGPASDDDVDVEALRPMLGDYIEYLREHHSHVYGPEYLPRFLRQLRAMWLTPLNYSEDDFKQIRVPALIVNGDRDTLVSLDQATDMYRLIPSAELLIAPNTDHGSTVASPTVTHAALDFLQRNSQREE